MDIASILKELGTLGPSLGAVVVVGAVCYFLVKLLKGLTEKYLKMFDDHLRINHEMSNNMRATNEAIIKMNDNVKENTEVTREMRNYLKNVRCAAAIKTISHKVKF